MKHHMPLLEAEPWCGPELGSLRRLKRRPKELPGRRASAGLGSGEPSPPPGSTGLDAAAQPFPPRPLDSAPAGRARAPCRHAPQPAASPRKRAGAGGGMKALQQSRRLLANARERSRVHTISAAFEALRKQVPCYSYGQKLSKLAILRIACNYILSLARLADLDYSADHSNMSFSECVEHCTRTLQAEGRSKKRKVCFKRTKQ
uniref:Protein atonal homolog 8 n=1 Tax=Pelusios castaneus TaxID=367368 RepID=A0A8C8RF56_9SAUR